MKKAYGPQNWWPADSPFEVIVGAILTQNTAWTNVEKAILSLKRKSLLTPEAMSSCPERRLAGAIRAAGYYNVKARRLKNFLDLLNSGYAGDLRALLGLPWPDLRRRLLEVNGIGPETADSIVLYAAGKPSFVVDAYTRRIFSRLARIPADAGYDRTRDRFMARLPASAKLYNEYHALLVEHAKRHCRPRPKCPGCPLRGSCGHFTINLAVTRR